MSTYLTVGSICWDQLDGVEELRLGGSALFASRTAVAFGWDAVVVTSGTAELEAEARSALPDVELVVQRSPTDTAFGFGAQPDLGPQRLEGQANPIDLAEPRAAAMVATADVAHLAPVMAELGPRTFDHARQAPFVGVTPQGLLRATDADKRLCGGRFSTPWAASVDAAVLSEEEAKRLEDAVALRLTRTAVTRGERGCVGYWGDEEVPVAGITVDAGAVATIGAGDVFAASYFIALAEGSSFADALQTANATAAAHVARLM